jgi:hypothetical protein
MRHAKTILLLVLVALAMAMPPCAFARINVVTLPGRDSVQLTIYNSVDLTMVKETRFLTLRNGMNRLEFSWVNTLIDPTSVQFKPLTHADQVEALDVRFPARVSNTLEWSVQSEVSGEVKVEISYFTSGVSWAASYVAEVSQDERAMKLNGSVKVTNNSGEDYENAQVRLVVGVIRLVEEISKLNEPQSSTRNRFIGRFAFKVAIENGSSGAMPTGAVAGEPKEMAKESLSEYFLYTVEGRDTIPNGWSKMLPSFTTPNVAFASYYKYEKEQYGDDVFRHYAFTNNTAGNLGKEPLPDGALHVFRLASLDGLYSYQGSSSFKYIPVNERVELNLGADPEVQIHPKMVSWEKQDLRFDNNGNVSGWTVKESWEIELQNSKTIPVMADIRRNFTGDWSITSAPGYEKLDANKIKFLIPLNPSAKQKVSYQLTTHHGANATR